MGGFADLLGIADRAVREILGSSVSYAPGTGAPVSVLGVFDAAYQRVDLGSSGVSSVGPAVFLRLEDLPTNPETDAACRVTVAGVTYLAHTVEPDGLGGVRLLLTRTP